MLHKKLKHFLLLGLVSVACLLTGCSDDISSTSKTSSEDSTISQSDVITDTTIGSETSTTPTAYYTINTDTSTADASQEISETLFGIFLEDINYALDGGMYAELIKNRSFEYGQHAGNRNKHGWSLTNSDQPTEQFEIIDGSQDNSYLHETNPHYCRLTSTNDTYYGIYNKGFLAGMSITMNSAYDFSIYMKEHSGDSTVRVRITNDDGVVYAEDIITDLSDNWNKYKVTLTPTCDTALTDNTRFYVSVEIANGSVDMDMISLMPQDTYKGTAIRKDIGEMLEALEPTFLRFPGGCVIEGRDEESMYSWKDSIGNGATLTIGDTTTTGGIEVRPQGRSIWQGNTGHPYYTTYGIGFYEFFELCEILDCLPVPVLNAGMTCQVQSPKYIVYPIGSDEFKQCVQDALDLVEFCRGDASTTWGSVRIAMGHEEPFELKYIGIGNEQWQTEYFQHYREFVYAFEEAAAERPELFEGISLIVANGPSSGDRVGWNYVDDCEDWGDSLTSLVDEHYYEAPSFFFTNTHRYDSYDRDSQASVFLGEYAAQSNTLEAALAEAAYMTGLEKNGDIVTMACYAPLFGNQTQNQWTPDMIWYNNSTVYGSVNYYVQQMYSTNTGTLSLNSVLTLPEDGVSQDLTGKVGLGSWQTSVAYDNLVITDNNTGEILYENNFDADTALDDFDIHTGNWLLKDGRLIQTNTGAPTDGNTGDAAYVGDVNWSNYTLTVEGEILGGAEGFLIPVCVSNTQNNIFWNLGGWGNTVSCLQIVSGGAKSGQISGTVKNAKLNQKQTYTIKVVVDGNHIQCYLNDMKYVDYTKEAADALYESATVDADGNIIIKMINPTGEVLNVDITLENLDVASYESATATVLSGEALGDMNTFDEPTKMTPVSHKVNFAQNFVYKAPKYSLTVIKIEKK